MGAILGVSRAGNPAAVLEVVRSYPDAFGFRAVLTAACEDGREEDVERILAKLPNYRLPSGLVLKTVRGGAWGALGP